MNIRILSAAALSIAIGLALAGCGSHTASQPPGVGGTLTTAVTPGTNLDWFLPIDPASNNYIYNATLDDQIFKPLIFLNDQYHTVWKSSVASNITYNPSGTVYHVFLGKKWRWSNGQPVTAQDLMFTWNVIKAASSSQAVAPWPYTGEGTGDIPSGIESVVENNAHEVTFTLTKPANQQWFIYNGLIQLTPMPAFALNKYAKGPHPTEADWVKEANYLGSLGGSPIAAEKASDGPFKLVSASPNKDWVLQPNPDYGGYKPSIHKLEFVYEASSTSEYAALRTGQIDLGYLDPSQLGAKAQLTSRGYRLLPGYTLGVSWVQMNMWPGSQYAQIFDHRYVREALALSIDQNAIVKDIYKGYATPQYGPIPAVPKSQYYDASAEPKIPYDPTEAQHLLESHGWTLKNGVMTNAHGQQLKLTFLWVTGQASTQQLVELLQQEWANIGVKVTLRGVGYNEAMTLMGKNPTNSWQLGVAGWEYNGPGWLPTGGQIFSSTAPQGTGYANAMENTLIQDTHQPTGSTAQFLKVFDRYEAYTAKQLPFLWLPNQATINVIRNNVHGAAHWSNPVTADPQYNHMSLSQ